MMAAEQGAEVVPVWNKSHREHTTIGSEPGSVRAAADAAVRELGWKKPYHVDADHIRLETVDGFLASSRLLHHRRGRLDRPARRSRSGAGVRRPTRRTGRPAGDPRHRSAVRDRPGPTSSGSPASICGPSRRPGGSIGTSRPPRGRGSSSPKCRWTRPTARRRPPELLVILAAIADEKIPIQTIAPKFTGRFNKGVDYVGNVAQFEKEFNDDLAVIAFAVEQFGLPTQPQTERPLRQRQVLDLRRRSAGPWRGSGPACTSRRRAPTGWRR